MIARDRRKKSDLRQALDRHLRKLPADAPLHNIVSGPEIEDKLAAFDRADAIAIKRRRSYRRFGRFALWAMMTGATIGALVLLPIENWISGRPRKLIEALQAFALILTFIAVVWIRLRQSVGQWMQSRAEAEAFRADVFRGIMRAGADSKELLVPAFACFTDAHLATRFLQNAEPASSIRRPATPYNVVGYLLWPFASVLSGRTWRRTWLSLWPSLKAVAERLLPLSRHAGNSVWRDRIQRPRIRKCADIHGSR
jgi:hypothetical protein